MTKPHNGAEKTTKQKVKSFPPLQKWVRDMVKNNFPKEVWLVPKLLLGRSSGSWSFKNPIPKRELGNEQTKQKVKSFPL